MRTLVGLALAVSLLYGCEQRSSRERTAAGTGGAPSAPLVTGAPRVVKREQAVTPGDFRNARWGMSKADVLRGENSKPIEDSPEGLAFPAEAAGLSGVAAYSFTDDKLTVAMYILTQQHSEDGAHIRDYEQVREALTSKYGQPKEKKVWLNDLYRDKPNEWGMAVVAGHLAYLSEWQTPETTIQLMLRGDNFKPKLTVLYRSKALQSLWEKAQVQNKTKGL